MTSILLIDDDQIVHTIVKKALSERFELFGEKSGDKGIEAALEKKPDLILLDVNMPGKNGYETCEIIKSNPQTSSIPVIFLSASTSTRERLLGYEAGADDYLVKPFDSQELLRKLDIKAREKQAINELSESVNEAHNLVVNAMTGSSELGYVMRFVELTYGIQSIDLLAAKFLDLMNSFNLNTSVLLSTNDEHHYYSPQDSSKPLEKELLIKCKNENRIIDFGKRTIINYPKISVIIKNMPLDDPERYGRVKDLLPTVMGAVDAKVRVMETNQGIIKQTNITRDAFSGINKSLVTLADDLSENRRAAFSLLKGLSEDLESLLPSLALEEDQEASILNTVDSMIEQAFQRLDNGNKLSTVFSTIVNTSSDILHEMEHLIAISQEDVMIQQGATVVDDDYEMDVELF